MGNLIPVKKKPKPESERKKSMIGIWAGKVIGPEVEAKAAAESIATGHAITKNGLGREIFLWAFEVYKEAGSLAELKKLRLKDLETKKGRQSA